MDSICSPEMPRRAFLAITAGGLLAASLTAEAQQAGKVYRVGVLFEGPPPTLEERSRSLFRKALRELGWIDGQNIAFEDRRSVPIDRLTDRASEMVRLKVDVFYAIGVSAARAALQASPSIPIVLQSSLDPVEVGLAVSLTRPGGNVTGVTYINLETAGKRLELLKEIVPRLTRAAALWNADSPGGTGPIALAMQHGSTLGVRIQSLPVRRPEEFDRAFADMRAERASALWIFADPMLWTNRLRLAELAVKHRLPTVATGREFAEAGILTVYGPDLAEVNQQVAKYVDKILKGAKPADLPIEQPTRWELVVNLKTAKALGVTIPQSLLLRATQVIE